MAKKRSAGTNVSKAIRDYLQQNADASPKAAAEEISKQVGKTVTPTYVSNIKTSMKKAGGTSSNGRAAKRRGRKPQARAVASSNGVTSGGSIDLATLEAVKQLVRRVGADDARRLIDILA